MSQKFITLKWEARILWFYKDRLWGQVFRGLGLLMVDDFGAGVSVPNKYLFIWDTMQIQSGLNLYAQ